MNGSRTIHAVSFDFGMTLAVHTKDAVECAEATLNARGFRFNRATIAEMAPDGRLVRQIVFKHSRCGTRALDAAFLGLYAEWFVRLDLAREDVNQMAAEALQRYQSPLNWALAPGAADMLDALQARGIATVILSNWDASLSALVARLNLTPSHGVLASAALRAAKPSRASFRAVEHRFSRRGSQILHIGDDPVADWRGARMAGLHALLIQCGAGFDAALIEKITEIIH